MRNRKYKEKRLEKIAKVLNHQILEDFKDYESIPFRQTKNWVTLINKSLLKQDKISNMIELIFIFKALNNRMTITRRRFRVVERNAQNRKKEMVFFRINGQMEKIINSKNIKYFKDKTKINFKSDKLFVIPLIENEKSKI